MVVKKVYIKIESFPFMCKRIHTYLFIMLIMGFHLGDCYWRFPRTRRDCPGFRHVSLHSTSFSYAIYIDTRYIVLVHQHDVTVVHRIAYHGENVGMKMRYSHFSYAYSIQQLNKALTVYDYQ